MTTKISNSMTFPLKEIFPKKDFASGNKQLALHFYVAHQNREATKSWSERIVKKYPQYLESRDSNAHLTPLAVSAMAGDLETAQFLVAHGANCKTKDAIGWTPLHYAYVRNDEKMIAFLEQTSRTQKLGLEALKNREGLTPSQLIERMNIPLPEDSEEVFHYRNEEGEVVAGTAKKFRELTGAQFSHRILVNREGMIKGWRQGIKNITDTNVTTALLATTRMFQSALEDPFGSDLYLAKDPKYGNDVGFDVHARKAIPAGQLISLYSGVEEGADHLSINGDIDPYKSELVNAKDVRNMGGMINDSFPNCSFEAVPARDGVSLTTLIIALEDIPKDSKIFTFYGVGHSVTSGHRELNVKGAEDFFTKHPISSIPKAITNLEQYAIMQRFSYLVSRPNLMYHLILKGVLNIHEVLKEKDRLVKLAFSQGGRQIFEESLHNITVVLNPLNQFKVKNPSFAQELVQLLIDVNLKAPHISMTYVIPIIEMAIQAITENAPDAPTLQTVKQSVEDIVKITTLAYQLKNSEACRESTLREFIGSLRCLPEQMAAELLDFVLRYHVRHFINTNPFYKMILESSSMESRSP